MTPRDARAVLWLALGSWAVVIGVMRLATWFFGDTP